MKKLTKKILLIVTILLVLFISFFLVLDLVIMPSVVEAPEVKMPNVVGIDKVDARKILEDLNLTAIEVGPRYDSRYK